MTKPVRGGPDVAKVRTAWQITAGFAFPSRGLYDRRPRLTAWNKRYDRMPTPLCRLLAAISAFLMVMGARMAGAAPAASVEVDARDAPRGIERVRMVLPVRPGKLTLLSPKWLPGEHSPDGPIAGLSGLKFSSNGQAIAWQRDADNMYAFHLRIPAGTSFLDAAFEVDAAPGARENNAERT